MDDSFIRFNSGKYSTWMTVEKNRLLGSHFVYILQCENDKLYCGTSRNIIQRLTAHAIGGGSNFTKTNIPLRLIHLEKLNSYLDAINRETDIWHMIKNRESISYHVMQEYEGIYVIIQELLLYHDRKWVINKLSNIT